MRTDRRQFLKASVGGGLSLAGANFHAPDGVASSVEEEYAVMRDENWEFTEGLPFRVVGLNAEFPLPKNGRQLARWGDIWICAYASYRSTTIDEGEVGYAPETEIRMRAWHAASAHTSIGREEVLVCGASGYTGPTPRTRGHVIMGEAADDAGTKPSVVIDGQGILHLAWVRPGAGEVWYARCDLSGKDATKVIGHTDAWRNAEDNRVGPERVGEDEADLGDICLDRRGLPCVLYRNRSGIFLARYDGTWRQTAIAEGKNLSWPIMAFDQDGVPHCVWRAEQGLLFYAKSEDGGRHWVGAEGNEHTPDFIGGYCNEAPTLAVARGEIIVAHHQGYKVVTFSHYDGRRWTQNTVLRGSYAHTSPMLMVDRHEVVWMHMVSPWAWTRTSRWLGDGWGDLQEGRRLDNMASTCSVERAMSEKAQEFGVILADQHHRLFFDTFPVPVPATNQGRHVMFLDLWEVARLEGVEQVIDPLEKDPRNPLMEHGRPGSWDAEQANFQGTILKEGDKYRVWYTGLDVKPYFPFKSACGYAESTDGVNWKKPDLGLYEYNGSNNNNICYPYGLQYVILRMPEELESDPAKRYRMAFNTSGCTSLAYSGDGIHWTLGEENPLWGRGRPGDFDEGIENAVYIRDLLDPDPQWRFKAYPQIGSAELGRSVGLMVSSDGIRFSAYPNNPVIDARLGVERQTHFLELCWRRHGVFIGLYGCYLADVNVDARLVVSRDGVHWIRVKNEVPFLPTGGEGSWDGGMVFPSNYPIPEGEDIWIYYSGVEANFASGEGHGSMGRGRVRLDGFGKIRLQRGRNQGRLTTVPLQTQGLDKVRLLVNVEQRTAKKGSLRVEVLDGVSGETLPGYSAEQCYPVTDDGIRVPVTWRGSQDLAGIKASSIRLRFYLTGDDNSLGLCSFGFE
jgi:hypothetical protein